MPHQNYYKELQHLKGYWFISCVAHLEIKSGGITVYYLFKQLVSNFNFNTPPFLSQNQIVNSKAIIPFPAKSLAILKPGQIFNDGKHIDLKNYFHNYDYNVKLNVKYNPTTTLRAEFGSKTNQIDFFNEFPDLPICKLPVSMFSTEKNFQFIYCPSSEIIRHLFFNGNTSIARFLDYGYVFTEEVIEFKRNIINRRELFIQTIKNHNFNEFITLVQLLTDNNFRKLYNIFRSRFYNSIWKKESAFLSSYFPTCIQEIQVKGKPFKLHGEWGLFIYQINGSNLNFNFDSLKFDSLEDGRSGKNKDSPDLEHVHTRKTVNDSALDTALTGSKNADSGKTEYDFDFSPDPIYNIPFSERIERGDQKTRTFSDIDYSDYIDATLRENYERNNQNPGKVRLVDLSKDLFNYSKIQFKAFDQFLESISLLFEIKPRIVYRDEKNLIKRPYSEEFNTIPIQIKPYKKFEFACFVKEGGYWCDRRGIMIIELFFDHQFYYLVEIERRLMKTSTNQFELLVFHKSNKNRVSSVDLIELLKHCRTCQGVWKKVKGDLYGLGLIHKTFRHTERLKENILSFLKIKL